MTLSDLTARLRHLSDQLQREGKYDPATHFILELVPGGVRAMGGMVWLIAEVLRAARKVGAFDSPSVSEFRIFIDGAGSNDSAMLESVFHGLAARGFDCWGLDPKRGAIERLADAFAAIESDAKGGRNIPQNWKYPATGAALAGGGKALAKPKANNGSKVSKRGTALASLIDHPGWTNQQIADAVGCHVKPLYRWPEFVVARGHLKAGRAELPKGAKDKAGNVEAWDDEE